MSEMKYGSSQLRDTIDICILLWFEEQAPVAAVQITLPFKPCLRKSAKSKQSPGKKYLDPQFRKSNVLCYLCSSYFIHVFVFLKLRHEDFQSFSAKTIY